MTDATISEMQIFAGWPAFPRARLTMWAGGIACAALVGSVVALSTSAPKPAPLPAKPSVHRAAETPAVDDHKIPARPAAHQARQKGVALDVVKTWIEERNLIAAVANSAARRGLARVWSPAGGLSILLTGRFPSAAPTSAPLQVASTQSANVPSSARSEASVPLPQPSPIARLKFVPRQNGGRNPPVQSPPQVAAIPPTPESGFFDFFRKLFGQGSGDAARAMLAANPQTAIYDIEDHVVYLPNGEKLEAHSGYGQWLDDPTSIDRKDRGVTPPNVYAISFRQQLFHGVRALRLTPIGNGNMYGRDGMLAHTYMLGPNGQSNGCVSFKDYQKFLQAFEDGEVKQLIVIPRIGATPPSRVASSQPGSA
jgi:hypothetical protein